jgi:hypothetical protein
MSMGILLDIIQNSFSREGSMLNEPAYFGTFTGSLHQYNFQQKGCHQLKIIDILN